MHITSWDHPAAAPLLSGLSSTPFARNTSVTMLPQDEVLAALLGRETDVALVSTLDALLMADAVDVLPAVGLSTWKYPFARIELTGGLELPPKTIGHDPRFQQEAVIARIILKEHYGMVPTFEEGFADNQDGRLILDKGFDSAESGSSMDLGQEWFELSGYPMLWGVFATRKGEADDSVIRQMQSIVRTSEAKQAARLQTEDIASEMLEFFSDHLRMRFDDLAIAGLTEFRQYLFYSGVLDEVTELPVVFLEEDEEEEEDDDRGPKLF